MFLGVKYHVFLDFGTYNSLFSLYFEKKLNFRSDFGQKSLFWSDKNLDGQISIEAINMKTIKQCLIFYANCSTRVHL